MVKKKLKNLGTLDIKRGDINIKQITSVTYLGCELDQYLSGESMVTKVLGKINEVCDYVLVRVFPLDKFPCMQLYYLFFCSCVTELIIKNL